MKISSIVVFCTMSLSAVVQSAPASPTAQQCLTDTDQIATITHDVLGSSTAFALQLLQNIYQSTPSTSNIIFSPMSIWSALMVAYTGARGQTASQLASTLGIQDQDRGEVQSALQTLKNMYSAANQKIYTLRMANRLFFDIRVPMQQCIQRIFHLELQRTDFANNAESARLWINRWVEMLTNLKIKDLLPPGSVDSLTKLIIVNAAYFKGFWKEPFSPLFTRLGNFTIQPGVVVQTYLMHQEATYPFTHSISLNCDAVELPYNGDAISMVLLLPSDSMQELISRISQPSLEELFNELSPTTVRVWLPKFKAEQTLDLKEVLNDLGIFDLFDSSRADLSGFTGTADSFVQSAIHKAYIEVNEEGTEAAAATSLITTYSLKRTETFRADRPFVFFIRDRIHNTILFAGVIRTPE